ncbi:hypothetical protein FEM54_04380 [Pseudomonas edaphica]|uniref:Type III secretion protein n=1 Tax=Pseudomonas edaphica TaxID=2006980 RepID=A0ABY2UAJ7_9PSED|nr:MULTISPECIES: hypothetical protein [Pseudomonas]NMX54929.1 hypothetical protein [Pseudomonas sp. WS 5146]NMX75637.1 hypothetical protein [Pseudomonas sp. WS 5532]TLG93327.1 hypothetical protein FEM54_04380 [Pseudomonas edaphica]
MDPLSMGMSAVSSVLPLAGKGMDLVSKGMDLLGTLVNSASQAAGRAQGKIGGDAHQKNEHQITFNNVNENSIKLS